MIRRRHGGGLKRNAGREGGFTIIELMLAMVLFGIIGYAALSLATTTFNTMARTLAEFDSRKRVLVLQREMAEGTLHYAGYLAGSDLWFGKTRVDDLGEVCLFRITFPDFDDDTKERQVEYFWDPNTERIYQRVDGGEPKSLLTNVVGFSVTRSKQDAYSIRVEIAHRVKGFREPIVRATVGQARNMDLSGNSLATALQECNLP